MTLLFTLVSVLLISIAQRVSAKIVVVQVTSSGFSPAVATLEPGDGINWISADAQAHHVFCDDANAPFPFGSVGTAGKLNQQGANWMIGTVNNLGTWNYRCNIHATETASFTVAPGPVETINYSIGPSCAVPVSQQVYLGDTLTIMNNSGVTVRMFIKSASGNTIVGRYLDTGSTYALNTGDPSIIFTNGLTYQFSCEGMGGGGAIVMGGSRNAGAPTPSSAPTPQQQQPSPLPSPQVVPTPVPTGPNGQPVPTPPPTPKPPTPANNVPTPVDVVPTPVPGQPPVPTPIGAPSPGVPATCTPEKSSYCLETCKDSALKTCDCTQTPPAVECARAPTATVAANFVALNVGALIAAVLWSL